VAHHLAGGEKEGGREEGREEGGGNGETRLSECEIYLSVFCSRVSGLQEVNNRHLCIISHKAACLKFLVHASLSYGCPVIFMNQMRNASHLFYYIGVGILRRESNVWSTDGVEVCRMCAMTAIIIIYDSTSSTDIKQKQNVMYMGMRECEEKGEMMLHCLFDCARFCLSVCLFS
jgi:hypothetical protein